MTVARPFTAADDAAIHKVHSGEFSVEAARRALQCSYGVVARRYQELYGENLRAVAARTRRPCHRFTEADRPKLREYSNGDTTMDKLCLHFGSSQPTIRKAMRSLGITLPRHPFVEAKIQAEPLQRGVWIPIAHKSDRVWEQLDGAPISIDAAMAAQEAGRGFVAHRRIDGGFDLLFKVVR